MAQEQRRVRVPRQRRWKQGTILFVLLLAVCAAVRHAGRAKRQGVHVGCLLAVFLDAGGGMQRLDQSSPPPILSTRPLDGSGLLHALPCLGSAFASISSACALATLAHHMNSKPVQDRWTGRAYMSRGETRRPGREGRGHVKDSPQRNTHSHSSPPTRTTQAQSKHLHSKRRQEQRQKWYACGRTWHLVSAA